MSRTYTEELVYINSEDGFRLDGVVIQPVVLAPKPVAVLCVPGLYSAFYDSPYIELGRALAERGYTYLSGNHRGHDFGAVLRRTSGEIVPAGGGWERLADCPYDIAAWVGFIIERGSHKVALLGHSMGARKVAYYQAERQDPRIAALIAASPFAAQPPDADRELVAIAQQMVDEGYGRNLLPWPEVGCSMSAATYLEQCVPEALFLNIYASATGEPPVASVHCPILAFFGANERGPDGADRRSELETIERNARAASKVETAMIADIRHNYEGAEDAVAETIAGFLNTLPT